MPFVQAKCPECGGMLAVDADKKAAVCQFCGEAFIVQEAINNYNTYNTTNNNYNTTHQYGDGTVVNVYEDNSKDFVIEAGVLKEYHGESVDVIVPNNVFEIGDKAFEGMKIKKIVLHNGITVIGNCAFQKCIELKSIIIPNTVKIIKYGAFLDCENIMDITIPSQTLEIGALAFSGCKRLSKLVIENGVKTIDTGAFRWCSNLLEITLPQSITYIGPEAFRGCDKLSSINYDISWPWVQVDFDNFIGEPCSNLITQHMNLKGDFVIPDGIKRIGKGCFTYCTELESIIIPDTVTEIGDYAFCNCTNLAKIVIPNSVTTIGSHAFDGCKGLKEIIIPDSVVDFGTGVFGNCELGKISIPNTLLNEEITTHCMNITVRVITPIEKTLYDLLNGKTSGIKEVVFSKEISKISGFSNCNGLSSVIIPNSVVEIDRFAFAQCHNLKEISIPDSVISIGYHAFEACPIISAKIPRNAHIGEFAFSKYWQRKGLCSKCGGMFNLLGKCKVCGTKR